MKYSFYTLLMFAFFAFISCGNKSEQEIEEEYSSGVVLIRNTSYYELKLNDETSVYFTKFDKKEGLIGATFDKEEIKAETSYGTGFIISQNGEIATNNHVVSSLYKKEEVAYKVKEVFKNLQQLFSAAYDEYTKQENELREAIAYKYYWGYDYSAEEEQYNQIQKDKQELKDGYNALEDIDTQNSELIYHNDVGIAYNDTHVTSNTDFIPCVVEKTDSERDLAIIQLKSKATPEGKHVFEIPEEDPLTEYSWLDKIGEDKNNEMFMIGYNLGPTLSITKEGVKAQFNKGNISQKTGEKLMYSIPALPGSSGSPIINKAGELVAVNYAGLNGTQNFNFGIKVKYLKQLLDK